MKCADGYKFRRKFMESVINSNTAPIGRPPIIQFKVHMSAMKISALLALWRFLRKESQLGMPQPAAALSTTNMMNPHLFFSSSLFVSCSSATFSSTFSTWRRSRCHKTSRGSGRARAAEEEEGGQQEGHNLCEEDVGRVKVGRGGDAPGISALHTEKEVQPRRIG